MHKTRPHKILLGFDFGMKRIGVAVGQSITQTANPLTTLKAQQGIPSWKEIETLINEWKADALIVGIPYNMDNTEQSITFSARKFANRLKGRFHLPVYLVDERLTTIEAKQQLAELGAKYADLKQVDSYAAKIILESWLKQHL